MMNIYTALNVLSVVVAVAIVVLTWRINTFKK